MKFRDSVSSKLLSHKISKNSTNPYNTTLKQLYKYLRKVTIFILYSSALTSNQIRTRGKVETKEEETYFLAKSVLLHEQHASIFFCKISNLCKNLFP